MEKKRTQYNYLYQCLREQIFTGYLGYGDTLPSLNQLCDIYQVGIRTAKDVVNALKEECLIQTVERRPSVVIYHPAEDVPNQTAIQSILEQRNSILQVYETMTLLMPCLFAFSVRVCEEEALGQCLQQLKRCSRKPPMLRWKTSSMTLLSLLDSSENLLFRDIFASLEIYAMIPFFLKCGQTSAPVPGCGEYTHPLWLLEAVSQKHPEETNRRLTQMYLTIAKTVMQYVDDLSSDITAPIHDSPGYYTWRAEQGRDHYYMQITRDLIDKIGTGHYKDKTFLPPESALASEYNVSVSTIRKAIAILNKIGFCHTYNVKGTQVTLFNHEATEHCMKNKVFKKDTLIYLSGLQFMAIAIRPAARLAFDHMDGGILETLSREMDKCDIIPLDLLMECVIEHLPLQPYRVILSEVKRILRWGYYYSFYSEGHKAGDTLNQKSMKAYRCLMAGEKERFADQLSQCYCHMLEFVRDFLIGCGLPEAASLITPHPKYYE